jgi:hypothetical protein
MRKTQLAVMVLAACPFLLFVQGAAAFYNAQTGCWPNRDLIGERGGFKLYELVGNEPISRVDALGLVDLRDPPFPPAPQPPSQPYTGPQGFAICQRDIKKEKCCDISVMAANCCGGEHTYLQYKDQNGNLWGYGWGGAPKPASEGAFRPNSCTACKKTSGTLAYGSGAGKSGDSASDVEIQDCIKQVKPSKPYNPLGYNCKAWALEAASKCGLSCK